jgi:hypothetical protein
MENFIVGVKKHTKQQLVFGDIKGSVINKTLLKLKWLHMILKVVIILRAKNSYKT